MTQGDFVSLCGILITALLAWRGVWLQKSEQAINKADREKAPKIVVEFSVCDDTMDELLVTTDDAQSSFTEQNLLLTMRNLGVRPATNMIVRVCLPPGIKTEHEAQSAGITDRLEYPDPATASKRKAFYFDDSKPDKHGYRVDHQPYETAAGELTGGGFKLVVAGRIRAFVPVGVHIFRYRVDCAQPYGGGSGELTLTVKRTPALSTAG